MSERGSMGQRAASSAVYVGISQALKLVLTTLSTVVVSRLLLPDDYGVIAMAAPVTGFIVLFQDLGLSQAVIQAKTISPQKSNALFWINMIATGLIMLTLLAISPLVAWFYDDPRAGYITAASALTVLVSGSSIQHSALLTREMRFALLSIVDMANAITTFIAMITAAFLLRSYWALWIGGLLGVTAQSVMLWRFERWRPSFHISFAGTRQMTRFGGNLTGFNLVNYLSRNVDNVLIARFSGTAQLGLYDRSYKLMMLPLQNINGPISRVMLPVLSRLRDEPDRYRRSFLMAVRSLMLIALPGIAVLVATSNEIIVVLLGERWAAAGPIFFWLSLAALIQPLSNATGWLFISSGQSRNYFRWGLFSSVTTLIGFAIGLRWGAVGIAASLFIVQIMRAPVLYSVCVRGTPVSSRDLWAAMVEPMLGAGLTWLAAQALLPLVSTGVLLCMLVPLSYAIALAVHGATRDGRDLLQSLFALATTLTARLMDRVRARRAV